MFGMKAGARTTGGGAQGRVAVAALTLAGLLAVTGDADAFCRSTTCRNTKDKQCEQDENGCSVDGKKLFWPTSCVSYAVNKRGTDRFDPEESRAAIRKTFQAWSDVACADGTTAAMTFQEREPVPCRTSEYNKTGANLNVVFFQDTNWKYRGIDATLAKTSVTYNDDTGEIYDADIEINATYNQFTMTDDPDKADTDLQAVLTHEVGHFIGIAHSSNSEAVMYAEYTPGSLTQRTLKPDDVEAVCAVYPADRGVACNTEPRGGFSATCNEPEPATVCSIQPGARASYGVAGLFFGTALLAARARRRFGASRRTGERK